MWRRKKFENGFFVAPWQRLVVLMEEAVFGDLRSVVWPILLVKEDKIEKLENFPTVNQATAINDGSWKIWAFLQKFISQIWKVIFHNTRPLLYFMQDVWSVKGSFDESWLPHTQVFGNTACCVLSGGSGQSKHRYIWQTCSNYAKTSIRLSERSKALGTDTPARKTKWKEFLTWVLWHSSLL